MKPLLLIGLSFLSISLFSQVEITSPEGGLTALYKWNDGYIGMSQKQTNGVYMAGFSSTGAVTWQKEMATQSYSNIFLAGKNSEFAYLVNAESVLGTGIFDTKTVANAFEIYVFDAAGEFTRVDIPYTETFGDALGAERRGAALEYLAIYSDGLVGVVSKTENGTITHALFTFDGKNKMVVTKIPHTLTTKQFSGLEISKPLYTMIGDELLIYQTFIASKNEVKIHIAKYSLADRTLVSEGTNLFKLDPNFSYGESEEYVIKPEAEVNKTNHQHYYSADASYATLGSRFNFRVTDGKVFAVATYYIPDAGNVKQKADVVGFLTTELSYTDESEPTVEYINITSDPKKKDFNSFAVIAIPNSVIYAVQFKKSLSCYVNGVEKGPLECDCDFGERPAVAYGLIGANQGTLDPLSFSCGSEYYQNQNGIVIYESIMPSNVGIKTLRIHEVSLPK